MSETSYAENPEWSDVTPIPLPYSATEPVVQIMYSERFKDVYSYVGAIMKMKEYSHRALVLTTDAIELNAANYTVWHYRREILRTLKMDLAEEFSYTESVMLEQPKNYQVWHHRRCLIEMTGDASGELALTKNTLNMDSKNYHAWDHRQWVLREYKCWDQELEYIDTLLKEDLRNNSAWNHRYFVIDSTDGWSKETVSKELEYTFSYIDKAPNNESSWNYANGIIRKPGFTYTDFPQFKTYCNKLLAAKVPSPFLLSSLAEVLVAEKEHQQAKEVYSKLVEMDSVRKGYWEFRSQQLVC